MFGYPVPNDIVALKGQPDCYWGARAIFNPHQKNPIDLLHDRQSFRPEGVESPQLLHWLNTVGLPWLRKEVQGISTMSGTVFTYSEGGRTIIASPNKSSGYLYIGCYYYNPPNMSYELQKVPENVQLVSQDDEMPNPGTNPGIVYFSGPKVPERGDRVKIHMNKLGTGMVVDYFVEHQWLGVRVRLDEFKDKGQWPYALVFGIEFKIL